MSDMQSNSRARALVVWWNRIRVMTNKEFLQLYRDRILIVFMVYAFTLEVFLAGSGVSMQLHNAAMAVTALYVFTTAGIGMLLATIARNLAQVGMLTALIFIPMVFLSGVWTPPENMPAVLRAVSAIAPLHHYIDASLGIMLKGSGVDLLWDSILAIALFAVATYGLSTSYFRRQLG